MLTAAQAQKVKKIVTRGNPDRAELFRALGDRQRYQIFCLLLQSHDLCVTDIARVFGLSVPAASHQLRLLELAGLAKRVRTGQMICFEVNNRHPLISIIKRLCS